MEGISSIIVIILLVIIITALVSMFFLFSTKLLSTTTQAGTSLTTSFVNKTSSCISIVTLFNNKLSLRNCGQTTITNGSLYIFIDDVPFDFNMTPSSMNPNDIATISMPIWGISVGTHSLKIVNPGTTIIRTIESSLPDSCVLALDFNEGSGTIAHDKSGYGNDGTLQNQTNGYVVWSNSGYFNNAVYFEGAPSNGPMVSLPLVQSLNITQPFTITAWINLKNIYSGSSQPILTRTGGSGNTGLFINSGSRLLVSWGKYASLGGDPISFNAGNINLNVWQHVAARYDESGSMSLYINGLNVGSTNKNVTIYSDELGKQFTVGYYWSGDYSFNGTIDSVRIFNKALTPDETVVLKLK